MTWVSSGRRRPARRKASALNRQLRFGVVALLIAALLTPNPLLSVCTIVAFGLIWFGAMNNPVNVVASAYLSFQWLQVSMLVFIADVSGVDLAVPQILSIGRSYLPIINTTKTAILLGLGCIVAISFAFRLLSPRIRNFRPNMAQFRPQCLLLVYLALLFVNLTAGPFVGGGLAQPLLALGWMRFVPVVLLFIRWFMIRDTGAQVLIIVGIEVVTGFLGFFSGFRNIFFILGAVILMLHHVLERRSIKALSIAAVLVLLLGGVWTAIKPTYREGINLGTGTQAALVSVGDRLSLLADLVSDTSGSELLDSFAGLGARLAYVQYLADAIRYVPEFLPHENGKLWGEAIDNIAKPRILFPDKPALGSDSVRTNRYTGRTLSSGEQGTSISMGYVADSYIDFGMMGALLVSVCLGFLYALIARSIIFLNNVPELSPAMAVIIITLFPIQDFGTNNTKLFGGIMWNWIIAVLFVSLLWPVLQNICLRGNARIARQ